LFAGDREIPYTSGEHGFIHGTMPPGHYRASLKLVTSQAEKTGRILSLFGLAILLAAFGISVARKK
jgi:hypothetical protein